MVLLGLLFYFLAFSEEKKLEYQFLNAFFPFCPSTPLCPISPLRFSSLHFRITRAEVSPLLQGNQIARAVHFVFPFFKSPISVVHLARTTCLVHHFFSNVRFLNQFLGLLRSLQCLHVPPPITTPCLVAIMFLGLLIVCTLLPFLSCFLTVQLSIYHFYFYCFW